MGTTSRSVHYLRPNRLQWTQRRRNHLGFRLSRSEARHLVVQIGGRHELPNPLIKSQVSADQNQTLTRKPNYFEAHLLFSSTMEGVCSAHVQAQNKHSREA